MCCKSVRNQLNRLNLLMKKVVLLGEPAFFADDVEGWAFDDAVVDHNFLTLEEVVAVVHAVL